MLFRAIIMSFILQACSLINFSDSSDSELQNSAQLCPKFNPLKPLSAVDPRSLFVRKVEIEPLQKNAGTIGLALQVDSFDQADFVSYSICKQNTLFCHNGTIRTKRTTLHHFNPENSVKLKACVWLDRSFLLDQTMNSRVQEAKGAQYMCGNELEKSIAVANPSEEIGPYLEVSALQEQLHTAIYSFVKDLKEFSEEYSGLTPDPLLAQSIEQIINLREIYHLIFSTDILDYFYQYYIENSTQTTQEQTLCKYMTLGTLLEKKSISHSDDPFYLYFRNFPNSPFLLLLLAHIYEGYKSNVGLRNLIEQLPESKDQLVTYDPILFINTVANIFPGYTLKKLNSEQKMLHALYEIMHRHSKVILPLYFEIKMKTASLSL